MEFLFLAKKLIALLVLPPTSLLLLALLALLLLNRWPRSARTALWLSIPSLVLLSLPVVSQSLTGLLDAPPLNTKGAKSAQAIMILGGGLLRDTPEYGDTLAPHSLARTRYGAKLAKEFSLPIIVTGGRVYGEGQSEAEVMANTLATEYSTPARWVETRSRDTAENALFSAALLKQDQVHKVILVTDDIHMRRALAHCAAAGLICYAAPVSIGSHASDSWLQQIPNAGALNASSLALHELLGNLALQWF
jgi:uncharacterized SAM-binding protein YcdF (DUF218 family)